MTIDTQNLILNDTKSLKTLDEEVSPFKTDQGSPTTQNDSSPLTKAVRLGMNRTPLDVGVQKEWSQYLMSGRINNKKN